MLNIKFKTSGAAFEDEANRLWDPYWKRSETVRILKVIMDEIDEGRTYGACMDIYGNKVGEWTLDED